MAEALLEPDVEAAVIAYLDALLTDASVSARVEDGRHLRVAATGGPGDRSVVIFGQQLTLEAFGTTLTASSALMRTAMAHLRALQHTVTGGVTFYGLATFGAGLNAVDPVTKRARYSRTLVIDVRLISL